MLCFFVKFFIYFCPKFHSFDFFRFPTLNSKFFLSRFLKDLKSSYLNHLISTEIWYSFPYLTVAKINYSYVKKSNLLNLIRLQTHFGCLRDIMFLLQNKRPVNVFEKLFSCCKVKSIWSHVLSQFKLWPSQ